MDRPALIKLLLVECHKAGNRTAFAARHGLVVGYLSDVIHGRRSPGPKILAALGVVKVVDYRRVEKRE